MSWVTSALDFITGGLGSKIVDRLLPDRAASREQQAKINEAEVAGGPASILRLWRSFLGWVLALLFCWEVVGRLVIVPLFFAQWGTNLPPSALDQIMALLLGMLGLGF